MHIFREDSLGFILAESTLTRASFKNARATTLSINEGKL
jgi:hypothetical protein